MISSWFLFVLGLVTFALLLTVARTFRVRRLSSKAALLVPADDALGWTVPESRLSVEFETPKVNELRAALVTAPNVDRWGGASSLADGVLQGLTFIEAGLAVDPMVLDSLERWVNHGDVFSGSGISSYLYEHHAAIFSAASHEGFQHALSGYFGEQIAATELVASGHDVFLPDATNVPAWDMQVDGHLFQVKTGITSLAQAQASVEGHPDIGIISSPDVASHFSNSIGLHDLSTDHLADMTSHSLHGLDTIASAGALHIPIITAIRSSWREINLLESEATTLGNAAKNISLDLAGTGLGAAGGAHAGAVVGTFFGPGIGTAIGAAIGAIGGAMAGRLGTDQIKNTPYRHANDVWLEARTRTNGAIQASATRIQGELQRYVSARDAEVKATLSQERRCINKLIAAERVNGANDAAKAISAFEAMLSRLEREVQTGLVAFEKQQHFNFSRAVLWPTIGDVAVLQARCWANLALLRIATTRSRVACVASSKRSPIAYLKSAFQRNVSFDPKVEIAAIIRDFFDSYRFEACDFIDSTDTLLTRGVERLVRVNETAAAASTRFQHLVTKVQREVNATVAAAYVTFSNEAAVAAEPARKAQGIVRTEAAKLGLIH